MVPACDSRGFAPSASVSRGFLHPHTPNHESRPNTQSPPLGTPRARAPPPDRIQPPDDVDVSNPIVAARARRRRRRVGARYFFYRRRRASSRIVAHRIARAVHTSIGRDRDDVDTRTVTLPAHEEQAPARHEYGKSMPASCARRKHTKYTVSRRARHDASRPNVRTTRRVRTIDRSNASIARSGPIAIDRSLVLAFPFSPASRAFARRHRAPDERPHKNTRARHISRARAHHRVPRPERPNHISHRTHAPQPRRGCTCRPRTRWLASLPGFPKSRCIARGRRRGSSFAARFYASRRERARGPRWRRRR